MVSEAPSLAPMLGGRHSRKEPWGRLFPAQVPKGWSTLGTCSGVLPCLPVLPAGLSFLWGCPIHGELQW